MPAFKPTLPVVPRFSARDCSGDEVPGTDRRTPLPSAAVTASSPRKTVSDFRSPSRTGRAASYPSPHPVRKAGCESYRTRASAGLGRRTLLAAAVAGFASWAHAADVEPEKRAPSAPDDAPPPRRDGDGAAATSAATEPTTIEVLGQRHEDGFKAEDNSTAGKIPLSVRETPQSVTVITRESLDMRHVEDLDQALELSAGVTQYSGNGPFAGMPSFGFHETTIRGIDIDSNYDVREDGFNSGTYFVTPDFAIYDRVEVVKGPSSTTYGRSSAGGIINRIRKKPLAEAGADLELNVGSFDHYRADLDATGPLLGSDAVRGRLVAAYGHEGSFVDGIDGTRLVLAPSLDVDLTPTTRLLVQGLYQRDRFVPNTGFPLRATRDGFAAPHISRSLYVGVPNEDRNRWEIDSGSLELQQQLADDWLATLRLSNNTTHSPIDVDSYAYRLYDDGTVGLLGNHFTIDRDIWSSEFRVTGSLDVLGTPTKVAMGVDHGEMHYARRGAYTAYSSANIYLENFRDVELGDLEPGAHFGERNKDSGAYIQAHLKPVERLGILLGLRWDHTSPEFRSEGQPSTKRVSEDVTSRIGVTWDLFPNVTQYLLWAQSFTPVTSSDVDGNVLKPETGEIFEAGLKSEFANGKLAVNLAVFRLDRERVPVPISPNSPFSVSSGLQRAEGIELEINGQPLPGWTVGLAADTLSAKFKDRRDPFYGHQVGGAADWQTGIFTAYELQTGPLHGLGIGTTLFAIDRRGVSPFELGTIPGYHRWDLHLFYKGMRDVEVNLMVRNVTDEKYIEHADRSSSYAQFGSPIAAMLSVTYSLFGGAKAQHP